MQDRVPCKILQEYLDINDAEGVHWKDASQKQIDRNVPKNHQQKILHCGCKNTRTCIRKECPFHIDYKE